MEYTIYDGLKSFPIVLQLYENNRGHIRLFALTKGNKMLTSVNLTKGLKDEYIELEIQIKVSSPQSLSTEERSEIRHMIVSDLRSNGISVAKKNTVFLSY